MGNKSSGALTLSFLFMAALCLEASVKKSLFYYPEKMNWTEARLYCQKNHIDLVTWKTEENVWPNRFLGEVWIGLLRDPTKEPVWKWINLKTGEGISGDNVSQSSNWGLGQSSSHCAFIRDDGKWKSVTCSSENPFYCSTRHNHIRFYKNNLSWYDANKFCENHNGKLSTITQTSQINPKDGGWIGLYREAGETWNWIGDSQSDYRNWAPGQPFTADCASFDPVAYEWHSNACSKEIPPGCFDDNLVVVKENKTWEEALSHCKDLKTPCVDSRGSCIYRHKLMSLQNMSDYDYVRDRIYKATTDEVWMGLRFLGGKWWWLNGEAQEERRLLDCPSQWKHCGTLSKYDTGNWITRDCSERRNFICQRRRIFTTYD